MGWRSLPGLCEALRRGVEPGPRWVRVGEQGWRESKKAEPITEAIQPFPLFWIVRVWGQRRDTYQGEDRQGRVGGAAGPFDLNPLPLHMAPVGHLWSLVFSCH
jgi:hypothetical protein